MRGTKMELYLAVLCIVFYGKRFTYENVQELFGVSRSEAYRIIRAGVEEGFIRRVELGVYTVARVNSRARVILKFMFPFMSE